jgi:hypothetical protein
MYTTQRKPEVSSMTETIDATTKFLTREQAAEVLSMKPTYLSNLGSMKRGPRFTKFGNADRSPVRYRLADVIAWGTDPVAHEAAAWGKRAVRNTRRQKAGR